MHGYGLWPANEACLQPVQTTLVQLQTCVPNLQQGSLDVQLPTILWRLLQHIASGLVFSLIDLRFVISLEGTISTCCFWERGGGYSSCTPLILLLIFYVTVYIYYLHILWKFVQVVRHTGSDELLLMVRMMQGSMQAPSQFSSHPAAAGTFFTLLFLGLKLCDCLLQTGHRTGTFGANLLCDRIYRYL